MHLLSERKNRVALSLARAANAKKRRQGSRAHRLAHAAQEPRAAALRYVQGLLALNAIIHDEVRSAFTDEVLAEISSYVEPSREDAAYAKTMGGVLYLQTFAHALRPRDVDADMRRDADARTIVSRKIESLRMGIYERTSSAAVRPLVDRTARDVDTHNAKEMKRLLGIDLSKREVGLGASIDKFREQNVALIRSIAHDQLIDVQKTLIENSGLRVEALAAKLQERFDVSDSRAALIARDQTLKLNGKITEARQKAVGITQYIWTTSRDERVRGNPEGLYPDADPSHFELDGQTFDWENPPEPGNPGEDYQCRCTAFPIIPELSDDTE